jgi:hypothetical protein
MLGSQRKGNRTIRKLVTEQFTDLHASPGSVIDIKWKRMELA